MKGDNEDLVKRAIASYLRNGGPDQPGKGCEVREFDGRRYVVLRNVRGVLAVYLQEGVLMLRRQDEWPPSLHDQVTPPLS